MRRIISLVMCLALSLSLMTSFSVTASATGSTLLSQADEVAVSNKALSSWPYLNLPLNATTDIKAGATFECDLKVSDIEAIKAMEAVGNSLKFYVKAYSGSNAVKTLTITLNSSQFSESVTHIKAEFNDAMSDITKILVQGYGKNCDAMIYVSNVKLTQPESKPTISIGASSVIGYGKTATASVTADGAVADGYSYQWYLNSVAINGATNSSYSPVMSDIGGWLYCVATKDGTTLTSDEVRIVASDNITKSTDVKIGNATFSESYGNYVAFLTNTKLYYGSFDNSLLVGDGYFRVEYTGGTQVPMFNFNTWSSTTGKSTVSIAATRSGIDLNGTKWAEYSYEDCVRAWGDNDFTELKALRVVYPGEDYADVTLTSVTWVGYPTSYGELGKVVDCSMSSTTTGRLTWIYTKHVGGDFDTSQLREDGYFYVEYSGEYDDAVYLTASSYSDANSTWANIKASENGKTANGYYSIFTVADIKASFGEKFRNFDQIRLMVTDGKSVTAKSATLYYFDGSGSLVDDISKDGYTDVLQVPWEMYASTDKNGVAIIGASIQQNPMVTDAALNGAPYYNARGDWNAVLGRTDCVNYGIGGETSTHISRRFDEVLRYSYNTIVMQCGTNDLGVSTDNSVVAATVSGNYRTMFEKAKAYIQSGNDLHIYVIPVLPSRVPANREKIEAVDAAISDVCSQYDFITYMGELYSKFLADESSSDEYVNTSLVYDNIHPNAAGYAIIAQSVNSRLLNTTDSDSTLSELSYRLSDTSAKVMVTDFKTGSAGSTYNVLLPSGTAKNATFSLYAVASDNGATVVAPTNVSLNGGTGSVSVTVTSNDGTSTDTYTMNFSISKYVYTDDSTYTLSSEKLSSWPAVGNYAVNCGKLFAGATIEFDVTVDGEFSGTLTNILNNSWAMIDSLDAKNITYAEFTDNKLHITYTVGNDIANGISSLQVKFGPSSDFAYQGNISVSNLKITNGIDPNEPINPIDPDDNTGFPDVGGFTGYICVDDNYHMQIGTGTNEGIIIRSEHTYGANGRCICGHAISTDSENEEEIIIEVPVESCTEEID